MLALKRVTNHYNSHNNTKIIDKESFNQWNKIYSWQNNPLDLRLNSNTPQGNIYKKEKKAILMIDDEETCLLGMELILANSNYHLEKANSGTQAIEVLKSQHNKIKLIFLDLMLPDIYGLDLLEAIKADDNLKNIPVILQTASINTKDIQSAKTLGAVDCLKKPYTKKMVIDNITKILE